jgi:hypothetical protein
MTKWKRARRADWRSVIRHFLPSVSDRRVTLYQPAQRVVGGKALLEQRRESYGAVTGGLERHEAERVSIRPHESHELHVFMATRLARGAVLDHE